MYILFKFIYQNIYVLSVVHVTIYLNILLYTSTRAVTTSSIIRARLLLSGDEVQEKEEYPQSIVTCYPCDNV